MTRWGHYALYAAEWVAILLAYYQFNRARPEHRLHQSYWLIVAVLIFLQVYGESWHR